jgi:hypothetical protein
MAKVFEQITPTLAAFIADQPLFFVGTAPLATSGHVNLSPKGLAPVAVLSPQRVAYLDLTGSGNETSAHLLENGRITLMFCAFAGEPMILRLYGQGQVVLPRDEDWADLEAHFPEVPGSRQIIVVAVNRVQTSCGYGVPLMTYQGQRERLIDWATKKGPEGLRQYQQQKGSHSIDGLPTPIGGQGLAG